MKMRKLTVVLKIRTPSDEDFDTYLFHVTANSVAAGGDAAFADWCKSRNITEEQSYDIEWSIAHVFMGHQEDICE